MKLYMKAITILLLSGLLPRGCSKLMTPKQTKPAVQGNVILCVYVVRHGESYQNVPHPEVMPEEILDSLTPIGLKQAAAAGEFLKDKGIVAVIASPTGRTRETADAICKAISPKERYSLDESFAPLAAGTTSEGEPATWSWREKQWAAGRDPRPEGGESLADSVARAVAGINRLAKKYPGQAVAVITHGEICAGLLGEAENTPITKRYEHDTVPFGSVSEIVITDTGWERIKEK